MAVAVSGTLSDRFDTTIDPVEHRKDVLFVESGIPGEALGTFRFVVTGPEGAALTLSYAADKARDIELTFPLRAATIGE
jgi:hypothetical protein